MISVTLRGESSLGLSNEPREILLDSGTVEDLFKSVEISDEILRQAIIIVNGKITSGEVLLGEGDEVLLHLPVTGG